MRDYLAKIKINSIGALLCCALLVPVGFFPMGLQAATAAVANPPQARPAAKATLGHQEILTHLLTAEMAMQRNMYQQALENYLLVAKSTNDPEVAQLATELALETQDVSSAMQAAEIWASSDPTNLQAQLIALTLYVSSDQAKANKFLTAALDNHPQDLDQNLVLVLEQLPDSGKKNLTDAMFALAKQRSKDPYAQLAAAQLAAVQLNIKDANAHLQKTLQIKPDLTNAIQLQAKLIRHEKNDDQPALDYLNKEVNKNPKDGALRMFYVLALIDNNKTKTALPHLKILTKDTLYAGNAYLLIGEDEINEGKYAAAEVTIKKALDFENSVNQARYYLAQLAEFNKKNEEAITWYEKVESSSEYHTQSFLRAAYLYSLNGDYNNALSTLQNSEPNSFDDQKQILLTEIDILIELNDLEKALESCNRVIEVLPNDGDFLYARSVINAMLSKFPAAERDLRLVINIDPNNANALNALGFILTIQPTRINEALPFIQQAMGISPNNPAFMDTLGWYYYKSGNTADAIAMLEKAYKLSGDNEIAAHLGEVLWTSGKQTEARAVWKKALLNAENKAIIQETLTRLNIPLSDFK